MSSRGVKNIDKIIRTPYMTLIIQTKGGEKVMIILSSNRKRMSELDKRKLAEAIAVMIPILIESNRVVSSISEGIQLESRLVLK